MPSWRKFAAKHRDVYQPNSAALELIEAKPQIEVIAQNGGLDLEDEDIPENVVVLDRVIAHAHTVRNNLFHGGKHGSGGGWDDPVRMTMLLTSTIGVLDDLADRGGFGGDYTGYY